VATIQNHTFKTLRDAIAAGYRKPSKFDRDISGFGYYGYSFQREDGTKTVTVWLTEDKNRMGQPGCFVAMYPPAPSH